MDAVLPYHLESGTAEQTSWSAARREFRTHADRDGRFVLVEQWDPGWSAKLDGRPAGIERWGEAFQSVGVPAGEHVLEFRFRAEGLRLGGLVTMVALICLCVILFMHSKQA
jgi:uncharacterized membrane protein YfhO